ncbi:MAG TPA: serine/threonine-protein kinase [Polyangia bacterium]|jgi:serine/threonine-protein kinase
MTDSGEIPEETGDAPLTVGTRLGKYQIVRLIGAGGMGAVYEAAHTEIGKRVAVKVLGPAIAAVPGARARFLREAQLTSKVRHPNIVDVTDMGNEGGQAFLVMEFLEGEDLAQRVSHETGMPQATLVDIMLPVCSAVAAAHAAGITHRDLKPQNIFLAVGPHTMQPKVLDFGISKGTDAVSASTLTGTGAMIGTPFYLAPEQIMDGKSAGPASDQYALGVILYECITGRRPFESENLFMIFQAIVNGTPMSPRTLRPDLSSDLERVILRAMNVDPKSRFPSVNQLGRMLLPFASDRARVLWTDAFGPATAAELAAMAAWPDAHLPRPANRVVVGPSATGASAVETWDVGRTPRGTPTTKIAVALGGLAAVGLVVLLATRRSGPEPSARPPAVEAPPAPVAAVSAPAVAPPPARAPARPASFKFSVSASPDSATFELDGEEVGAGPVERTLPIDHQRHVLRASAPGYETKEVEFTDRAPPDTVALTALPEPPVVKAPPRRPTVPRTAHRPAEGVPADSTPEHSLNPNGAPVID